jgi:hypothetical protein
MNTLLTIAVALNVGAWCIMVGVMVYCRLPDMLPTRKYTSMLMDDNY